MAKTEEGNLKELVRKTFKKLGWKYYPIIQWKYSVKGIPDNFMFKKCQFVFLEFKSQSGVQTPEQIEFEQNCIQEGIHYILVKSFEGLLEEMKKRGIRL